MSPFHRWFIKSARTAHLYGTLSALALVVFFSVTGFMLNHEDWFSPVDPVIRERDGSVPPALLTGPDKLGVVERLRKDFGAVGALDSFEAEPEAASVRVVFKAPGREFTAVIDRETGEVRATSASRGFGGLLMDLHRGKSTGTAWSLVIDAVCAALLVISATGLVLWSSLRGRGRFGAAVLVLGTAAGFAVYFAFVPR